MVLFNLWHLCLTSASEREDASDGLKKTSRYFFQDLVTSSDQQHPNHFNSDSITVSKDNVVLLASLCGNLKQALQRFKAQSLNGTEKRLEPPSLRSTDGKAWEETCAIRN
ncbi:hypothetical protein ATANTOWER_017226 [Ataeniobius toweri]|uniref:Uncharacterized protein n=1 Tax=Ataeniobius toweri TaxID=208326 RepID=A0ABU7BJ53_9TELE|nr:hypothetical protein [Ataeniobius toweri]